MVPVMQELATAFQPNKQASRSAQIAFFLSYFLEKGMLAHVFVFVDWAAQVMIALDNGAFGDQKLLLHQQMLHEAILAPMSLVSTLISGEFLKRGEIKQYLQPNEMSPTVAILKLRLSMMTHLY